MKDGHEAVVRALIEAEADITKFECYDMMPLCYAARQRSDAYVRALIEAGAEQDGAFQQDAAVHYHR